MSESISEIKQQLKFINDPTDQRLAEWSQDTRKGVQTAVSSWHKRQKQYALKQVAFQKRFDIEKQYWAKGLVNVAGIDEVGRGPLAGPVVSAAVILPHDFNQVDVIDSKQLSADKRDRLYDVIMSEALAIGIGQVDAETIDAINIYQAARLAMTQAVQQLSIPVDGLLIDAMQLDLDLPQESLIKGDARSNSIGAASIIAKVTRDRLMAEYGKRYPAYGFQHNAGYGTKEHLVAIEEYGITPLHRKTFAPIKNMI